MTMAWSNFWRSFMWCMLASFVARAVVNDLHRFVDHVINSAACKDSDQVVRPMPRAHH